MKKLFFFLCFLVPLFSYSQKQGNIWYFGDHAGVDFSSGNPVVLTNGATYNSAGHSEGTSVMCDSTGSLLFYTNGQQVWNKNHQIMPNGDSLLGHWSSTQSSIIVPLPGSSEYFYVFTTDAFFIDALQYGFRYSILDICLDNGLGDIVPAEKNIKLLDTVAEKLTAVKHANGNDYWIITHKYYSDAFYSYHLSSAGIVDTVISHVGSRHPTLNSSQSVGAAIGDLKASPDGRKLAIVNGQSNTVIAEYFDFDNTTGVVSNCVSIQPNPIYSYYGVSFSADNSKLYISGWLNVNGIFQYDLNAGNGDPDSVRASRTTINNGTHYGMQLGVDGKIYLARMGVSYLDVINNPNNAGLNCNYVQNAIMLNSGVCSYGLPNFVDSYNYSNNTFNCSESGIAEQSEKKSISLFPNPFSNSATLQFSTQTDYENTVFKMYDVFGREIKNIKVESSSVEIEKENLPEGFYFWTVSGGEKILASGKIVVE